jgi:hypothetical protein
MANFFDGGVDVAHDASLFGKQNTCKPISVVKLGADAIHAVRQKDTAT